MTTVSDLFGEGWFPAFVILSLYGLSSLFMVIEVFWLNSIRRPWVRLSLSEKSIY